MLGQDLLRGRSPAKACSVERKILGAEDRSHERFTVAKNLGQACRAGLVASR